MLIKSDHGYHCLICEIATLRGQRTYRHMLFSTILYDTIFNKYRYQVLGAARVDKEPNLGNAGFVLRNGALQPPARDARIVRGDWLLTEADGKQTLVDVTTTSVTKVSLSQNPLARAVPGFAANKAVEHKTKQYVKKWHIPQAVPLVIAAFEMSGRWHKDTVNLVETYLSRRFPDRDRKPDQAHGFAMALDYVRKCISVAARSCVANALVALVASVHNGLLVPVALGG